MGHLILCHYAQCRYAYCHIIMGRLSVVMLSVVRYCHIHCVVVKGGDMYHQPTTKLTCCHLVKLFGHYVRM
jgi:hypothetical protein